MKVKILLWILAALLLINVVNAALINNNLEDFNMDDSSLTGSVTAGVASNFTGVINGATTGAAGKILEAFSYDGGNDWVVTDIPHTYFEAADTFTICAWVNWNTNPAGANAVFGTLDGGNVGIGLGDNNGANYNVWRGSVTSWDDTGIVIDTGAYHLICLRSDGAGNITFTINDTDQQWDSGGGFDANSNTNLTIGDMYTSGAGALPFKGEIDEFTVWDRKITAAEITELYNLGVGCTWPFNCGSTNTTDILITLDDDFNSSVINTFSVQVSFPNGTLVNQTTTNGTITMRNLSDSSIFINVTYYNVTGYYELVSYDNNLTANITQLINNNIYQAEVHMIAHEKISNKTITGASFYTGTKSGTVFNITAGTHAINFSKGSYYNKSQLFTITAVTNTTRNITEVYSSIVNLTAYYPNGSLILNWGANVTSLNYTTWPGEYIGTTNGTIWLHLINGTYTAAVNSSAGNNSFEFEVNGLTENITFFYFGMDNCSTFSQVTLNFTLLNEVDNSLLNGTLNAWFNVTSDFFLGYLAFNLTFTDGNYYAVCVPNNTITNWTAYAQIEYSLLPTYAEKNYYLINYDLSNETNNINLFLTNGTTQINLQVKDYNDDPISDAYVKVLSYDLGTNSYKTTEIIKTDSSGDAYAQIVQNTAWYAFIVEYNDIIILQTLPTKLTSSSLILRADLGSDYFINYDIIQGVSTSLIYTNATTTYSFTWSDPSGSVAQGCLQLTRNTINGETLLNSSCISSSAATILMNLSDGDPGSNSYRAEGYLILDGQNFAAEAITTSFRNTFKTFGLSGVFFSMLLIITLVMIGLWHPVAAIVLMVFGVVVTNVMGIFYMNWTYIITFIILATVTIYRTGRSE